MIKSFKSPMLEQLWKEGHHQDMSSLYVYQVSEILDDLHFAKTVNSLIEWGHKVEEYLPSHYAVVVTVNNVEPCGSVTYRFHDGNAFDVNFKLYNA